MAYCTAAQVTELTGQNYYDTVYILTGISGTFVAGETITGGTTSATATVTVVHATYLEATPDSPIVEIDQAEVITGGTSSATGTVSTVKRPTKPTLATVTALIDRVDGEIDHILNRNAVDVPIITDADLLLYLQNGSCYGVASMIEAQLYVQTENNDSTRASVWRNSWNAFRKELRNRPELINKPSRLQYSFPDTATTSIDQIT